VNREVKGNPVEHDMANHDKSSISYARAQESINNFLIKHDIFDHYLIKCNPYSMSCSSEFQEKIDKLQIVLSQSIVSLVNDYMNQPDLQEILPLSDDVLKMVAAASNRPYRIGSIRPDFVIDEYNCPRICEINARFAFNGLIISNCLNAYFSGHAEFSPTLGSQLSAMIEAMLANFDRDQTIYIIKGKEKGFDIHFVRDAFQGLDRSIDVQIVKPESLSIIDNVLFSDDHPCHQAILELHQDELLSLPDEVRQHLITKTRYINDVRTICIVHDKRFLSILTNKEIMSRYLQPDSVALLCEHIIPTYPLKMISYDRLMESDAPWVFKKNNSGKGDGMYQSQEISKETLKGLFEEHVNNYIAQPFIVQKDLNIFSTHHEIPQWLKQHAVGMIFSFHDRCYGRGAFRVGTGSIINCATAHAEMIG
jgi:hypothetical protein